MTLQWLSPEEFLFVVARTPLVAMDLLVQDAEGRVLLGIRRNRPARGYWFVPGGRITKDEPLAHAFARITESELGTRLDLAQARFRGVYEHFHPDNFAGVEGVTTHYVVLAYQVDAGLLRVPLPQDQHAEYRWWPVADLLRHPRVHPFTKAYFER